MSPPLCLRLALTVRASFADRWLVPSQVLATESGMGASIPARPFLASQLGIAPEAVRGGRVSPPPCHLLV